MKKINALLLIALLGSTVALAQAPPGKGGAQLNAGLGFSSWGVPVHVGLDFGVHPDITIGPDISYRNYRYRAGGFKWDQSLIVVGFNGNYHFNTLLNIPSEWNFYAGLTLGYYIWSDLDDYVGAYASGVRLAGQIGGRYFFSDKFGLQLELGGGGFTGGTFGVTIKLK
jgi:outer membrane immunogenic protein